MALSKRRKLNDDANSPDTRSAEKYDNIFLGDNPMVDLKVGVKETLFHVHRGLICDASPFFQAAFTRGFRESFGSMTLKEDNTDTFGHIVQWLYRRKLETLSKSGKDTGYNHWTELFQLYVLADKYEIVPLMNDVLDLLFGAFGRREQHSDLKTHHLPPQANHINYVYMNTVHGSQLRRFVVAYSVWHVRLDYYEQNNIFEWLKHNAEIGAELTIALALRAQGQSSPFVDRSSFHERIRDQLAFREGADIP
ncbi:MAG: hypothetical protein Q9209_004024 [Squamulea sp. 1 TL-2023]